MSLHISTSDKSPLLESVFCFNGQIHQITPSNQMTSAAVVCFGDIANWITSGRLLAVKDDPKPLGHALGFAGYFAPSRLDDTFVLSEKPVTYEYDAFYDRKAYGDTFQQAFGIVRRAFELGNDIPILNDKHTRHSTYYGRLAVKGTRVPWLTSGTFTVGDLGYTLPNVPRLGDNYTIGKVASLSPLSVSYMRDYSYGLGPPWSFTGVLDLLKSGYTYLTRGLDHYSTTLNQVWRITVTNVRYSQDGNSFWAWYSTLCENLTQGGSWTWNTQWYLPLYIPFPAIATGIGYEHYGTKPSQNIVFSYSDFVAYGNATRVSPSAGSWARNAWYRPYFVSMPSVFTSDAFGTSWGLATRDKLDVWDLRRTFDESVRSDLVHIRPSAAFSAANALQNIGGPGGSNLQTLLKLPQISSAIPDIRGAIEILQKIHSRDLSLATYKSLLDLATSTFLQGNFTWRPLHAFFMETLPQMYELLPQVLDTQYLGIGYGSYSITLKNVLGRETVRLVTRTKVVTDISLHGLVSASYTLDTLGVLPTPSRVFDTIPFSFVLNWFTGVSGVLRNMEVTALSAVIPVKYVHTYSLTSPFSTDELLKLNASSSGDVDAGLKVYYRDVSRYSPVPSYSKFPFGVPTTFPSLGIVGSLVYQLLASG